MHGPTHNVNDEGRSHNDDDDDDSDDDDDDNVKHRITRVV